MKKVFFKRKIGHREISFILSENLHVGVKNFVCLRSILEIIKTWDCTAWSAHVTTRITLHFSPCVDSYIRKKAKVKFWSIREWKEQKNIIEKNKNNWVSLSWSGTLNILFPLVTVSIFSKISIVFFIIIELYNVILPHILLTFMIVRNSLNDFYMWSKYKCY